MCRIDNEYNKQVDDEQINGRIFPSCFKNLTGHKWYSDVYAHEGNFLQYKQQFADLLPSSEVKCNGIYM